MKGLSEVAECHRGGSWRSWGGAEANHACLFIHFKGVTRTLQTITQEGDLSQLLHSKYILQTQRRGLEKKDGKKNERKNNPFLYFTFLYIFELKKNIYMKVGMIKMEGKNEEKQVNVSSSAIYLDK